MKNIPSQLWKLIPKNLGERKAKMIIATLMVLTVLVTMGSMWAHKEVEVKVDDQVLTIKTTKATVKNVLQEAGVTLGNGDEVRPSLSTNLKEGTKIQVHRAVPVTIIVDGHKVNTITAKPTVREVLHQQNIVLNEKDVVKPRLDSRINPSTKIEVSRVVEKIVTRKVIMPNKIERRPDARMSQGEVKVLEAGSNGWMERTIKVTYINGEITKRDIVEEKILEEPVNKIVIVGNKKLSASSGGNVIKTSRGTFRYRRVLNMNASAYAPDPRCTGKYGAKTASGMRAGYGVVAVDRGVIPLGTRLYVEGYGHAIAGDVGGAIRGNKIDLCFETYNEALRFGRRMMKVYILE